MLKRFLDWILPNRLVTARHATVMKLKVIALVVLLLAIIAAVLFKLING